VGGDALVDIGGKPVELPGAAGVGMFLVVASPNQVFQSSRLREGAQRAHTAQSAVTGEVRPLVYAGYSLGWARLLR